jgi:hypothetical protein
MDNLYQFSILLVLSLAAAVFILLFFISAPYGKFLRKGWGPSIKSRWAWMIMESPSPLLMIFFIISAPAITVPALIFLTLWLAHYLHRTFIYPFTQSGSRKEYPLLLVGMALVFNCFNGFINGYGIFWVTRYDTTWLGSWQFISGILIFATGYVINKTADEKLRRLRKSSNEDYVVPRGWLFEYISCPHYFGEMVEWGGWALLTWSVPGLTFFIFTVANLFPRAVASHNWYRRKFQDYPSSRKAVIPFIV